MAAGARFIPKDAVTGDFFARIFAMLFWIGAIGCLIASATGFCLHFARTLGLRLEAAAKSARRERHGFPVNAAGTWSTARPPNAGRDALIRELGERLKAAVQVEAAN